MQSQSLTGQWQFRQEDENEWLPATVPGGVHTDLLTLGLIPDPFIGDNELDVMWVAEKDWTYRYTFNPDVSLFNDEKVFLVADGLDTLASVSLNGEVLGKTNNQFRQWRHSLSPSCVVFTAFWRCRAQRNGQRSGHRSFPPRAGKRRRAARQASGGRRCIRSTCLFWSTARRCSCIWLCSLQYCIP